MAFLVLGSVGCGSNDFAEARTNGPYVVASPLEPVAPYYATVTATGPSCPEGTWEVDLDALGEVFTTTYAGFEATLEPMQAEARAECALDVTLGPDALVQLALHAVHNSGYANLDPGVVARQEISLELSDSEVRAEHGETFAGPVDTSYLVDATIQPSLSAWSRCQAGGHLAVRTSIVLTNDARMSGVGYVDVLATDATATLGLRWRRCRR